MDGRRRRRARRGRYRQVAVDTTRRAAANCYTAASLNAQLGLERFQTRQHVTEKVTERINRCRRRALVAVFRGRHVLDGLSF